MTAGTEDNLELERFIDGELSFAERRSLLRRLDQIPDGWRRLALGLLEDQAFRGELQLPAPAATSTVATAPAPVAKTFSRSRLWTGRATLAVMCLFCFAAGSQWEQGRDRDRDPAGSAVVALPQPIIAQQPAIVTPAETAASETVASPAAAAEELMEFDDAGDPPALVSHDAEDFPHQTMKVVFPDWPTDGQPIEVPVVESSAEDADAWLEQSALPDDVRRQWEAAGYLIYEHRKYVPVPLQDGRQGIAPVSDVVVEYIGTNEYQ